MIAKGDFIVINAEEQMPDFEALAKDNPSLLQLVAQKNAAAFSLKSTYGNFFPSLSVSGDAGKTGNHWAPSNNEWDAGLKVSFPLFEGGERLAQVDQARATLNQLVENERSEKDSVVATLQQEWVSLQDSIGTVDVQKKQLAAAQERSEIANVEFSTGFMNYDNWTIIEDNLVQAKTGYLSAQVNALLAEANWIAAKGGKLEYVQ
jgi:outer membrane protein TolC